jgi:transcriptional regulator with XRE-family HTH domain
MTHASYLKEKARQLRTERKLTLDEIADRLALPRTTIYYWIRDLRIPETERQSAARLRASRANSARASKLREAAYGEGVVTFERLHAQPTFIDFVCIYIGEGSKRNRNSVAVCNSDPAVIKLATAWLRRLSERPLEFRIQYHADQNLDGLREFWASQLDIEPVSIRFQRKSNSRRMHGRQWRSPYGVLTVRCNDTYLRSRLQAWIDLTKDRWLDS